MVRGAGAEVSGSLNRRASRKFRRTDQTAGVQSLSHTAESIDNTQVVPTNEIRGAVVARRYQVVATSAYGADAVFADRAPQRFLRLEIDSKQLSPVVSNHDRLRIEKAYAFG